MERLTLYLPGFDFFVFSLPVPEMFLLPPAPAECGLGSGGAAKLGTLASVERELKCIGDAACLLIAGSSCCLGDDGLPKDS